MRNQSGTNPLWADVKLVNQVKARIGVRNSDQLETNAEELRWKPVETLIV
jgi:hypothetical protein